MRDAYGQELPGPVGELGGQLGRHLQHQRDRVGGLADDIADPDPAIRLAGGHGALVVDVAVIRPPAGRRAPPGRCCHAGSCTCPPSGVVSPSATRGGELGTLAHRLAGPLHTGLLRAALLHPYAGAAAVAGQVPQPALQVLAPVGEGLRPRHDGFGSATVCRRARFSATSASHVSIGPGGVHLELVARHHVLGDVLDVDVELFVPAAQLVDRAVLGAQQRVVDAALVLPDLHVLQEPDADALGASCAATLSACSTLRPGRRLTITPHCSTNEVGVTG